MWDEERDKRVTMAVRTTGSTILQPSSGECLLSMWVWVELGMDGKGRRGTEGRRAL